MPTATLNVPAERLIRVAEENERRAGLWREGASSLRARGDFDGAKRNDGWADHAEDFALRLRYLADA